MHHSRLRQQYGVITARGLPVLMREASTSLIVLALRTSHLAANRRVRSLGAVLKCMLWLLPDF